jgi:hypothetical protein
MTIATQGDKYIREEISQEDAHRTMEQFEMLRQQLRQGVVMGRPTSTRVLQISGVEDALGKEFVDSVALALAEDIVLATDDVRLLLGARQEWGVKGASSYDVMMLAAEIGDISRDDLERYTVEMIRSGRGGIPMSSATLSRALREDGYQVGSNLDATLAILGDQKVEARVAIGLVVEFLRDTWLGPLPTSRARAVVKAAILAIGKERPGIGSIVRRVLREAFRLAPEPGRELDEVIGRILQDIQNGRYVV